MTNWPIGLSTGCFYQRNILDCLEPIRESGFSMIEVCSSPNHLDYHDLSTVRQVARRIEELGMEAYSFHAPFADWIDISAPDDALRERAATEILQAAQAAALLKVHYLVIHPGPERPNVAPHDERLRRMENVVNVLNRVAKQCTVLGISLALENKLPHLLFGQTSDILWILDAVESTAVGVCLDTGHAFLSGDLSNLMRKLAGHLRLLHVHDNRRQFDDHLPPGDGHIDWEALLKELVTSHFHGALVLELSGNNDNVATLASARRGRSFLRGIARRIALAPHQ